MSPRGALSAILEWWYHKTCLVQDAALDEKHAPMKTKRVWINNTNLFCGPMLYHVPPFPMLLPHSKARILIGLNNNNLESVRSRG